MRFARLSFRRRSLRFEQLEDRLALSASISTLDASASLKLGPKWKPTGSFFPVGLTPDQVREAYGFDDVHFGGIAGDGAGQTIAIVDARNDPNIVNDLAVFDQTFGLPPPPSFTVVNQTGGTKLPKNSRGWSSEIALDVEWAHAIAPAASILLVEAKSSYSLGTAIDYARHVPGVTVISVSAGGKEFRSERDADALLTTPAGHVGITFVFAAGDEGGKAEYPSSSPNVLSVGGTTLDVSPNGDWNGETVWADGGGGLSKYEGVPSYQNGLGLTARGTPDVTYDGDPETGFAVYDSYGIGGWGQFGGTSAGTPQWAALVAIANQGRVLAGKAPLANAQAALYAMPRADFHDITSGNNGQPAAAGYDLASGLGSPIANFLISDLVAFNGSTNFTVTAPAPKLGNFNNDFYFATRMLDPAAVPVASEAHHSAMAPVSDSVGAQSAMSNAPAARPIRPNTSAAFVTSSPARPLSPAKNAPRNNMSEGVQRAKHSGDEFQPPAALRENAFVGIDTFFATLAG